MPAVDVVIVNWNSREYLRRCVGSLRDVAASMPGMVRDIIVVDNASTDGSAELDETEHAQVRVVRNTVNRGFAAGCNQGAALGEAPYILFLNPDAATSGAALQACVDFMEVPANRMTGICSVQLVDDSGAVARSCARFPSASAFVAGALGLDRAFPCVFKRTRMAEWDHGTTRAVDQVIGAFFLIRRPLFAALNGFDERYFVYFEEVDLSYRARLRGYRSVYLAEAQAYHRGGVSSEGVKAKRLFYSLRSRLLYAFKHFGWVSATVVTAVTLVLEPASRLVQAVLRRSPSALVETVKGYGYLWAWIPRYLLFGKTR